MPDPETDLVLCEVCVRQISGEGKCVTKCDVAHQCMLCFGIMDQAMIDEVGERVLEELKSSPYDSNSFILALSLPVGQTLREILISKLRPDFNGTLVSVPFKVRNIDGYLKKLGSYSGKRPTLSSDLQLTIVFDQDEMDLTDFAFLSKAFPNNFRTPKRGRENSLDNKNQYSKQQLQQITSRLNLDIARKYVFKSPTRRCAFKLLFERDPVYIAGRYCKYSRCIPQSPWSEEKDAPRETHFNANECRFVTSGREDIDVRMLGTGRPFVVELKNCRTTESARGLNYIDTLMALEKRINIDKEVKVNSLTRVSRDVAEKLNVGEEDKRKQYCAYCYSILPISDENFDKAKKKTPFKIVQKTPVRVMKRRSLLDRERTIHSMSFLKLDSHHFSVRLETQAGTYIKEFVHGDFGRTHRSLAELLGVEHGELDILELDVENMGESFGHVEGPQPKPSRFQFVPVPGEFTRGRWKCRDSYRPYAETLEFEKNKTKEETNPDKISVFFKLKQINDPNEISSTIQVTSVENNAQEVVEDTNLTDSIIITRKNGVTIVRKTSGSLSSDSYDKIRELSIDDFEQKAGKAPRVPPTPMNTPPATMTEPVNGDSLSSVRNPKVQSIFETSTPLSTSIHDTDTLKLQEILDTTTYSAIVCVSEDSNVVPSTDCSHNDDLVCPISTIEPTFQVIQTEDSKNMSMDSVKNVIEVQTDKLDQVVQVETPSSVMITVSAALEKKENGNDAAGSVNSLDICGIPITAPPTAPHSTPYGTPKETQRSPTFDETFSNGIPPIIVSATVNSSSSTESPLPIDNKIEQAMELVKTHLTYAVREEVDTLRSTIAELEYQMREFQFECNYYRQNCSQEIVDQANTFVRQQMAKFQPPSRRTTSTVVNSLDGTTPVFSVNSSNTSTHMRNLQTQIQQIKIVPTQITKPTPSTRNKIGNNCIHVIVMVATVLMVAEKPMLAESIANLLSDGKAKKRKGWNGVCSVSEYISDFQGKNANFKVTSTCGHVMSLDFPQKYNNWEKVDPAELYCAPIVKNEANSKMKMKDYLALEGKNADYLVLWLDCDKEGENICFEVIDAVRSSSSKSEQDFMRNVYRAHFSAITEKDIKAAMRSLGRPNENISQSVDVRQELDLRIGCAFTRFQTKFFQGKYGDLDSNVISYGPCQTPTLEWDRGRVFDSEVARLFLERVKCSKMCTVTAVNKKESLKEKPRALNTVELMRVASSALGLSPSTTMHIAEKLYTQGYISYPRTETTAYPINFDLNGTLKVLTGDKKWGATAIRVLSEGIQRPKSGVDKGDHPPITPMKLNTGSLSGDMARIYEYIAQHFIATLMKPCIYEVTTVKLVCSEEEFTLLGKTPIEPGFTLVMPWMNIEDESKIPQSLATVGATAVLHDAQLSARETVPPGYLTESELITLMEKHGIGTDASIPVHINTITQRNYVTVDTGRRLVPTRLGQCLVRGYWNVDPELVLPSMRAELETQLNLVATGEVNYIDVKNHALKMFNMKFQYFVNNIAAVDTLFEASFTTLSHAGKPFSRCGKCRRYMKLVQTKPQRLFCPTCQDTYSVPNDRGGVLKVIGDHKCPLDDFDIVLWQGPGGKLARSYTFCPFCYNNKPFENMPESSGCDKCYHPSCSFSMNSTGICTCLQNCEGGIMLLDPQSHPKWRLTCNKCPSVVTLFEGASKVKVNTSKQCGECGAQFIRAELKENKDELRGTFDGCIFCEATKMYPEEINLNHAFLSEESRQKNTQQRRGKFDGRKRGSRGRGRGRGSS
ncbi:unnamed protein product [Caenorhabditis sp. 36 PRJEB53466]|nr:unnamed protein product [Caenorhabditis sp. 36 PRJEB53466]